MGEVRIYGRCPASSKKVAMENLSGITFAAQAFVTLFVIMDPPGVIPMFLALVAHKSKNERRALALQAALVSFIVITTFALFGQFILNYLHVSMAALQAAGGLLLLYVSLELLTGKDSERAKEGDANIALVPLGTPLLAGPGAIVATMVFVQRVDSPSQGIGLVGAIIGVHIVIAVALLASTHIYRLIKDSGVTLVARVAGLLLSAIAVQMFVDAVKAFIAG